MVIVSLAAASICFAGACHPVLVGDNTPAGTFKLSPRVVTDPGYGGDLLVYRENARYVWAIHRVYTLNPGEDRIARLRSPAPERRRSVTKGCINVMPEVYDKLMECCRNDILVIN